jgi:hypothetical protein
MCALQSKEGIEKKVTDRLASQATILVKMEEIEKKVTDQLVNG